MEDAPSSSSSGKEESDGGGDIQPSRPARDKEGEENDEEEKEEESFPLRPVGRGAGHPWKKHCSKKLVDISSAKEAAAAGDLGRLRALREGFPGLSFSSHFSPVSLLWWDASTVTAAARSLSLPCLAYCVENGCEIDFTQAAIAVVVVAQAKGGSVDGGAVAACLKYILDSAVQAPALLSGARVGALLAAIDWVPSPSSSTRGGREQACWTDIMVYLLWGGDGEKESGMIGDITTVLQYGDDRNALIHRAVHAGNLGALWLLWEVGMEFPSHYRAHRPADVGETAWAAIASFWEDGYADRWADGEPAPLHSVKPAAVSSK